jgi:MYXO-CTERM domain-containing protein
LQIHVPEKPAGVCLQQLDAFVIFHVLNRRSVMRTLRDRFALVLTAAAGITAMSGVASAAYLSLDFQGDTVGDPPSGTFYLSDSPPTNIVTVVDGSSSPADPFGGAGNKSMLVQDDTNATDTRVSWKGAPGGLVNGVFKTQFYLNSSAGFTVPYVNIRLGKDGLAAGGTSEIAAWLLLSHPVAPGKFVIDNSSVPYDILDNAIAFNTIHEVEITFDSTSHTFTGKLDGNPLTANSGTKTTWDYYTNMSMIDSVMFNAGSSSTIDNRVFIDNVSLDAPIPEPSMLGLAGLGLAAFGRRQRLAS